jgi:hypothetical protein
VRVLSAKDLLKIPEDHFRFWCHKQAIYAYPTSELIGWLQEQIGEHSAIEIGAGNGAIGRALGIPITDSRMQEWPDVKAHYALSRQPTVNYGSDIQEFDASSAVEHFKPDVVIGSWITHLYHPDEHHRGGNMYGVDEVALFERVKKYVHIGATSSHSKKRILKEPHQVYRFDWLLGRGKQDTRCIWVWE